MTYHVVFPDFSGFQVEIPGVVPSAEPRRRGSGGCAGTEGPELWPDSPVKDRSRPDEENG